MCGKTEFQIFRKHIGLLCCNFPYKSFENVHPRVGTVVLISRDADKILRFIENARFKIDWG